MTLLRWSTFLLGSHTRSLTVWLFWIYFFLLMLVFLPQWFSFHWETLIVFLSQFPLTFHHIHNEIPNFIALLMTILVLIGMVFVIIWEIFHGRISLNSVLLLLLVNFASGSRLELLYISLIEGIGPSFTHLHGFQQLVLQPYFIEITFFCKKRINLLKAKLRQANNCCKRALEVTGFAYANQTKESITSKKLGSQHFWRIAKVFLIKVNLLYLSYSTTWRCCLLHLIKQNYLLTTFVRTLILMTQVSL